MPVLDVVVNPSGALSGARTVQRSLADIGRSAVGMERTMGGAVSRLRNMMLGLFAGKQIKNLAKGFLDAAVTIQNYQTSLKGVIKDADEAKKTFDDINKWAALNPVDTDDAIRAFVMLKMAAVDNAKGAIEAMADMGTVFQKDISDIAMALVSLNTMALRQLNMFVDRTGKNAIVTMGSFRKEVENNVDAIRAAFIEGMQSEFAGQMQKAGNNWSSVLKTMGGQWNFFQQAVMGSTGSGGPFDRLNKELVKIKDRWNEWMGTKDYETFVARIQGAVMRAIDSLLSLGDKLGKVFGMVLENVDKIISALKALASVKISGWMLALLGVTGTAGKLAAAGVGALVYLKDQVDSATYGIKEMTAEAEDLRRAIKDLETSQWVIDPSRMTAMKDQLALLEGQIIHLKEMERLAAKSSGAMVAPIVPDDDGKGAVSTASGPSAAERLVSSIRDKMQYLYADGKDFLPVLDQWAAKLKPLSEDWKKIVDLQRDIRSDESKKAADDAIAAMERLAEKERQQTEALEAARAGVQKFWSEMSWANQQGLVTDENYFDMLVNDFNNAKSRLEQETGGMLDLSKWSNWSEEMKTAFASAQTAAQGLVSGELNTLNEQLQNNIISQREWNAEVQKLLDKYNMFPAVINKINTEQGNAKKTSDEFGISAKLWANELSKGLADAIVNAQDLGDALRNVLKAIAGSFLQKIISKILPFADGAAFQGGHVIPFAKGGIVTKPTIFPMARGMGLMGEAGPEAVMPLKRGSDGKLGVEGGGGTTYITVHINAIEPQSFAQAMRSNKAVVESVVIENIMRNGAVRSAIRGAV